MTTDLPLQLKYAVLFTAAFCLVQSQRPWHAGSSNRLPQVLPQYIDERIAAEQAAQASQVGQAQAVPVGQAIPGQTIPASQATTGQVGQGFQGVQGAPTVSIPGATQSDLGNRIGEADGANAAPAAPSTTTINPLDLPVDAHGDIDLVNRIMTWPREKWPFWFINWQAIQAHRGDANNPAQPAQTQPNTRSFFAG